MLKTIPPMLETVTKGFRAARNRLAGKQEITPELVDESLRDIRVALLEADVAFDVVKSFVARVREKAVGATVQTTITDKAGATQFVVSLFAKLRVPPGQRAPKGEEIKVTLEADPGPGFGEDDRVELVNARLNAYQLDTPDGRTVAGISFKAMGLTPASDSGARHAGNGGGEK